MEREKPTFDILGRIEKERAARNWSEYALAENSGLTQSTISTWRRRNLQPNVAGRTLFSAKMQGRAARRLTDLALITIFFR